LIERGRRERLASHRLQFDEAATEQGQHNAGSDEQQDPSTMRISQRDG
jgi:general stress protein YciG